MTEAVAGSTIPRRILGVALRQARTRAGKTQVEAAEAIDQSEQTVRRMASRERVFDPLLVNGLLQADGYLEEAIRAIEPEQSDEDVAASAEVRRSRQQLLTRPFPAPLRLDAIVAEPVLLVELTEGVMRAQLWKLLKATELPM